MVTMIATVAFLASLMALSNCQRPMGRMQTSGRYGDGRGGAMSVITRGGGAEYQGGPYGGEYRPPPSYMGEGPGSHPQQYQSEGGGQQYMPSGAQYQEAAMQYGPSDGSGQMAPQYAEQPRAEAAPYGPAGNEYGRGGVAYNEQEGAGNPYGGAGPSYPTEPARPVQAPAPSPAGPPMEGYIGARGGQGAFPVHGGYCAGEMCADGGISAGVARGYGMGTERMMDERRMTGRNEDIRMYEMFAGGPAVEGGSDPGMTPGVASHGMDGSYMGGPAMGGHSMGGPPMGGPPMGGPYMGGPPMRGPAMGRGW